ncbi:MAG: glycosyltransferase [Eggerthellaceae bacterium]|nr:glycosyltransferase [Eggerthellaceae bacterium]
MDNSTLASKHTFAICAYKKSPFLEECIKSVLGQKLKTNYIMVTSTPSEYIELLSKRYDISLFVRDGIPNIADDWNFAIKNTPTQYVTIAHQDDIYEHEYSERFLKVADDNMILFFTDYGEIRDNEKVLSNTLLNIKRFMLRPIKNGRNRNSVFIRRQILSFGSAICCPSVTFNLSKIVQPIFEHGLKSNLDWQAWEKLSKLKGSFFYDSKVLMFRRIHADSETSRVIEKYSRSPEDLYMFKKFWPVPLAILINRLYSSAQKSNKLNS